MSHFPTSPFISRSVIAACSSLQTDSSETLNCGEELLTLAAMLSSEDIFLTPRTEEKRIEAGIIHSNFGRGSCIREKQKSQHHSSGGKSRIFVSGDHLALLRIYSAFIAAGEDSAWCRARYLRYRALKAAKTVRGQLEEVCIIISLLCCIYL